MVENIKEEAKKHYEKLVDSKINEK